MSIHSDKDQNIFEHEHKTPPKPSITSWLIGRPLATADAPHQTIGKIVGLAVFSSDALSSVAYGPQEMMMVLALAGAGALHLTFPIAIAILGLLLILIFSYEQTIHAYPDGGGAYIVSRDNISAFAAQTAGAALLTDYILTVAVSISSGTAQIVSAFPDLIPFKVEIAVIFILLVMLINLRGVRESGTAFAIPTYIFIGLMYITIVIGLFRYFTGTLNPVTNPPEMELVTAQGVTLFLILRSFANGTASLTGVEAISNGITAFKEPRSRNAGIILLSMGAILGSMLIAISFLAVKVQAIPSESETIISQIARAVYDDRGILYLATISVTTIILVMAANTAFAGFPRLSAMLATDGYLPRQLAYRGSRLVYSRGIIALAGIASILVVVFRASVSGLIPLYAIGVFLSFTLSQSGMAHRWWKSGRLPEGSSVKEAGSTLVHDRHWLLKMLINSLGALTTLLVTAIFAITKFKEGAWIIIFVIPILVTIFSLTFRHYKSIARQLSLDKFRSTVLPTRMRVIIPIGGVHRGTMAALRYARSLSDDITAVHVSLDPVEAERIAAKWEEWGGGYRMVILNSPFRLFYEPLLEYIDSMQKNSKPGDLITIVVPQFVTNNPLTAALHTKTAESLRRILLVHPNLVITEVPYQVKEELIEGISL